MTGSGRVNISRRVTNKKSEIALMDVMEFLFSYDRLTQRGFMNLYLNNTVPAYWSRQAKVSLWCSGSVTSS